MTILVTGGAGYIGSHTVLQLLEQNYSVVVLDNLSNSSQESLNRVTKICNKEVDFIEGDVRDANLLQRVFNNYNITSVIHFAGSKAVGESVEKPVSYYNNNVAGTLTLLEQMKKAQVYQFVFSSTATVYGDPESLPIDESMKTGATTNPYGTSKYMVECILKDLSKSDPKFSIAILRYFNPVGAHPSGLIGENPKGIPNNLLPYISQVAVGKLKTLKVFGNDYDTPDGTGVRDYIHVVDLAKGHLKALNAIDQKSGVLTYNLGTGKGYSVLEIIDTFKAVTGIDVPYEIVSRREGDIAACYADPQSAKVNLDWQAEYVLSDMLKHIWHWQSNNPNGYQA